MSTEPNGNAFDDDLRLALQLADAADAISLPRFGSADLEVRSKPDMTPVSDADLAVETALRELLQQHRPDDSVLGEEFGDSRPGARRRWVIDPIDGTKNFVRGVPVWATLIALVDGTGRDARVVVGVVSAPALSRRWWAALGGGSHASFAGGSSRPLRVSGVSELGDASLCYSDLQEWDRFQLGAAFRQLADACWRSRGYGDFWSYLLVAEGAADLAAEPELSLWDVAALAPIVTEAGGRFTTRDGEPVDQLTAPHVNGALASNGLLHDQLLGALGAAR
ncbi:histidinol-phosphatase [Nakamurella aerolata]|uniref:Histidinol-phosphatase n=1 Tax=Nakamurella aerolata TaxID=1656892 RepID=A0A849A9Q3_9ACTN|nr:histidinol-phosphatase [Nakamurella aerolata]